MKATAFAPINMALCKYWGKRDENLILPQNSSLSITLEPFGSTTTVEFSKDYKQDLFILDGETFSSGEEYERVVLQLTKIREKAGIQEKARVVSKNAGHTAAGLASSASGAAALGAAACKAAGLSLTPEELSISARLGSGSACRSVHGGFVQWSKGRKADGSDSYAVQLFDENYWPELRMLAVVVSTDKKKVKSRAGMKQTVETSPFYPNWLQTQEKDIDEAKQAIKNKDVIKLGQVTERNWLKFQGLLITTQPAIHYWLPTSLEVIHTVYEAREEGIEGYITMDAGPQVKILCLESAVSKWQEKLKTIDGVVEVVECRVGEGVKFLEGHLF